jgi:hypothetical protein
LLLSVPAFTAEIPAGTHVLLRMVNSLTTRTARDGDQVYLVTASPIAAGGRIVVPVGSYVQGTVAQVSRGGRVSGRAQLALHLDTLTLAGGRVIKIAPHVDSADAGASGQQAEGNEGAVKQAPERGRDAARIAVLAGSGAAIGGLADESWKGAGVGAGAGAAVGFATALLTRGRDVELRAGSTLDVVFDRAVEVE